MIIFFGLGSRRRKLKLKVKHSCDVCSTTGDKRILKIYDYFHIFFIPIIVWGKKYFLFCERCQAGLEISKADFKSIKKGIVPPHLLLSEEVQEHLPESISTKESEVIEIIETSEKEQLFDKIDAIIEKIKDHPKFADNKEEFKKALISKLKKEHPLMVNLEENVNEYFIKFV